MLSRPPEEITVGEVVRSLERKTNLTICFETPEKCERSQSCVSRNIWSSAFEAMYVKVDAMTLSVVHK